MAYEFRFPDVGQGITEGTIVKWRVKEGDRVEEDESLGDIETDKAVVEMPSPKAGIILKRNSAKEGEKIRVGEIIAVIGEKGEKTAKTPVAKGKKEEKGAAVVGFIPETMEELEGGSGKAEVLATLRVRKLAEELGVGLSKISGTGHGGRITEEDVRKASRAERGGTQKDGKQGKGAGVRVLMKHDMWGFFDRVPLKGIRKSVAEKMSLASRKAALLTNMDEADATTLAGARERLSEEAEKNGTHLTYMPLIIRAVTGALKKNTHLNASLDEENNDVLLKKYYNIGFAVDTENGLVVPVIKGADMKGVFDISEEMNSLTKKARSRKIDLMDMQGGSFTVTNLGAIGGGFFTPIPNYPESAILGIGRMAEKPVAENGKIIVKKTIPLSLSYDHRIVDGAQAARFLNTLKELLSDRDFLEKKGA